MSRCTCDFWRDTGWFRKLDTRCPVHGEGTDYWRRMGFSPSEREVDDVPIC